jgi:hypothetical protein
MKEPLTKRQLAHPNRAVFAALRILNRGEEPLTANTVAAELGVSPSMLSTTGAVKKLKPLFEADRAWQRERKVAKAVIAAIWRRPNDRLSKTAIAHELGINCQSLSQCHLSPIADKFLQADRAWQQEVGR